MNNIHKNLLFDLVTALAIDATDFFKILKEVHESVAFIKYDEGIYKKGLLKIAAGIMGAKGGSTKSEKKAKSSAKNGADQKPHFEKLFFLRKIFLINLKIMN